MDIPVCGGSCLIELMSWKFLVPFEEQWHKCQNRTLRLRTTIYYGLIDDPFVNYVQRSVAPHTSIKLRCLRMSLLFLCACTLSVKIKRFVLLNTVFDTAILYVYDICSNFFLLQIFSCKIKKKKFILKFFFYKK